MMAKRSLKPVIVVWLCFVWPESRSSVMGLISISSHPVLRLVGTNNVLIRPDLYARCSTSFSISGSARYLSSDNADTPLNLITSTKSNTVKKLQSLRTKRRKRTELQATVVEGPRMVFDLLNNPVTLPLVQQVLISTEHEQDWYKTIQRDYPSVACHRGTPELVQACSDTVTPQGIIATVSIPQYNLDGRPEIEPKRYPFYLVLDGVSDPGNVGTLLRSSVAVGITSVVLLPDCCDVWAPKAVRSSMGCSFQVPIVPVRSLDEAQELLRSRNVYNIFAATMEESGGADSVPHYEIDLVHAPAALVIGSEGTGLSQAVREALVLGSIEAVHVPMEGRIESLNAAVCGSVILFEYLRQCRTTEPKF